MLLSLTKHFKINIDEKFYKLSKKFKEILFNGSHETIEFNITKLIRKQKNLLQLKQVHGKDICNIFERNYNNAFRFSVKRYYEKFLTESICRECDGARLNILQEMFLLVINQLVMSQI